MNHNNSEALAQITSMQEQTAGETRDKFIDDASEEIAPKIPYLNLRRRGSLDVERVQCAVPNDVRSRRSSIGASCLPHLVNRRSSLGEDLLRLNLLRRSSSSSSASLYDTSRRLSLDSEEFDYDPRRRASLGAESLIEYDLDEDQEAACASDPPPEALLGLQYADDVFSVKRQLELQYHPKNCLLTQPQVTEPMRRTLVNWLVKVNKELKFGSETVFLAVNLLDRFLACSAIASDCSQLLAICALFVASKMEESKVPSISCLGTLCSATYRPHHFRRMEILLLTKLGFSLHAPSAWYFISYLTLKACQHGYLDRNVTCVAHRVAETCLCHYGIMQFLPSIQAAAALLYAVMALNPDQASLISEVILKFRSSGIYDQQDHPSEESEAIDHEISESSNPSRMKSEEETSGLVWSHFDTNTTEDALLLTSPSPSYIKELFIAANQDLPTNSDQTIEMINVVEIIFSPSEREEIVCCLDVMTKHLAPFEEFPLQPLVQTTNRLQSSPGILTAPVVPANSAFTLPTTTFSTSNSACVRGTVTNDCSVQRSTTNKPKLRSSILDIRCASSGVGDHPLTDKTEEDPNKLYHRRDSGIPSLDNVSEGLLLHQFPPSPTLHLFNGGRLAVSCGCDDESFISSEL